MKALSLRVVLKRAPLYHWLKDVQGRFKVRCHLPRWHNLLEPTLYEYIDINAFVSRYNPKRLYIVVAVIDGNQKDRAPSI